MKTALAALALVGIAVPAAGSAQALAVPVQPVAGTRLEVNATGEVTRVPDVAIISAGVVTQAPTATAAIQQNAARMERVRDALRRAGIADRDIQTSSINLNPEYRHAENRPPQLVGYTARNSLSIRFRDIRSTGRILDVLVAEGANEIHGPNLTIDEPEQALDEARVRAVANGRQRAELYARALGMRVARLLSVSESGGHGVPRPMPMAEAIVVTGARGARTDIEPGEQKVQVGISMVFELQ